jgi:hypothetical protein
MGLVVRATPTYAPADAAAPASLIVKLASEDEGSRSIGLALGVYEAEVRFYQDLAPTIDMSLPRCHFAGVELDTGWFTLVFDDLTATAQVGDMVAGGTVDQASAALDELVRLQAPRWDDPALRGQGWLADRTRTIGLFAQIATAVEPFLERFGTALEPEQIVLIERVLPQAADWVQQWSGPFVIQHGDYRLDNILFGTTPGAPAATVVDWQTARLGPPTLDAAYYLGGCLSTADRRAHERDLVAAYHRGLVAAGVTDWSLDECWESYRRYALYGLYLGVGMSVRVQQTERGDALFAGAARNYADLALDLEADALLRV